MIIMGRLSNSTEVSVYTLILGWRTRGYVQTYMLHPTHGSCRPWIVASHPSMGGISMDGRPFHGDLPYISWMSFLPPIGLPSMDGRPHP